MHHHWTRRVKTLLVIAHRHTQLSSCAQARLIDLGVCDFKGDSARGILSLLRRFVAFRVFEGVDERQDLLNLGKKVGTR
jgi:hypothetical protein